MNSPKSASAEGQFTTVNFHADVPLSVQSGEEAIILPLAKPIILLSRDQLEENSFV
jgi:hypothetical protein